MKNTGKCQYCGDPIYDFQEVKDKPGYHEGCWNIEQEEKEKNSEE